MGSKEPLTGRESVHSDSIVVTFPSRRDELNEPSSRTRRNDESSAVDDC
jgi:hypothetical protein